MHQFLADTILVVHAMFVLFVVGGLMTIWIGRALRWSWVRDPLFRSTHLVGISIVVIQAWCGRICPLTLWEQALRARAGQDSYAGSFVAHWMHQLLFFDLPNWMFVAAYTIFAAMVLATWILVPPNRSLRRANVYRPRRG